MEQNIFLYKGYCYDVETGLYYCNTRYYNPEWGRWLNADDVSYLNPESIGGLNLYAYCLNNPVMYSDPEGTFVITLSMLISAAIIGAVSGAVIGAAYGGLTAVANGEDFWNGAIVGGISGLFMGAGAGIGAVFLAPVLAGASITLGTGFVVGTSVSAGTALAIGSGVAFSTGFIAGGLSDISFQLLNNGKVNDWGSVGLSALEWGAINTLNAFACAGFEAFSIAGIGLGYLTGEAIALTCLMNIGFSTAGFLIDILRASAAKRGQTQINSHSYTFSFGY